MDFQSKIGNITQTRGLDKGIHLTREREQPRNTERNQKTENSKLAVGLNLGQ